MKRKDILMLVVVGIVAAVISFIIAGAIFKTPSKRDTKVPQVDPISTSFPDIKNDPAYQSFINSKSLDPAQPVQIGGSNNGSPFNN